MRSCSDASSSLRNRRSTASFLGSRFATGVRSEPPLPALLPYFPRCRRLPCGSQASPVLHRAPGRRALAQTRVPEPRREPCSVQDRAARRRSPRGRRHRLCRSERRRGARSSGREAAATCADGFFEPPRPERTAPILMPVMRDGPAGWRVFFPRARFFSACAVFFRVRAGPVGPRRAYHDHAGDATGLDRGGTRAHFACQHAGAA